jgi:hypothetical protein
MNFWPPALWMCPQAGGNRSDPIQIYSLNYQKTTISPTRNIRPRHATRMAKNLRRNFGDMKQRGSFEESLIGWTSKFGRSPC